MLTLDGHETHWLLSNERNRIAQRLADRHYSRKHPGSTTGFVGPGQKIVLLSDDGKALFVWVYAQPELRGDKIDGVYCSIFRNEGPVLSSILILEAERFARQRWPGKKLFTYVNKEKVKSKNPGWCFQKAGWQLTGVNKSGKLRIFEKTAEVEE